MLNTLGTERGIEIVPTLENIATALASARLEHQEFGVRVVCFYDIGGGFNEVALNVTSKHLLLPSKAFVPADILTRADGATYQSKPGYDPLRHLAGWIMTAV
ncbi:MAG: hypothetical protein ACFCUX_03265 [Candidatus Methylacidiphilales bacterium]